MNYHEELEEIFGWYGFSIAVMTVNYQHQVPSTVGPFGVIASAYNTIAATVELVGACDNAIPEPTNHMSLKYYIQNNRLKVVATIRNVDAFIKEADELRKEQIDKAVHTLFTQNS